MCDNKYIRFDWAAKRMLRDKANFGVLEGLVTVLLNEQIHITEILESEGNQEDMYDKFNRVDIKATNSKGEIIIVEIQLTRELYYLERILYGVAKAITEHISLGEKYDKVKKVYSINILYFDLGQGADYLYHGRTTFRGVHTADTLVVNSKERDAIRMKAPEEIFPEYFIIRVNEFNKVATTPLEEWLDYLKNGHIKENTTAPGLGEALVPYHVHLGLGEYDVLCLLIDGGLNPLHVITVQDADALYILDPQEAPQVPQKVPGLRRQAGTFFHKNPIDHYFFSSSAFIARRPMSRRQQALSK